MIVFETIFQFSLPKGIISSAGIDLVQSFITRQDLRGGEWLAMNPNPTGYFLPLLPDDWQWQWLVQNGSYRGNFPRRASAYYHRQHKIRCPESFLSELGNLARRHSETEDSYTLDFTNKLLGWRGQFRDYTCYHDEQRQCLMNNNAFAIRFYENGQGAGRAWIAEIESNLYIVFNGYGFETVKIARIFAAYTGLSYKKIDLTIDGQTTGFMYVNDDSGYLVGASERIADIYDYDLEFNSCYAICEWCGACIENEDNAYRSPDGETYCADCYHYHCDYCHHCGNDYWQDDLNYVESDGFEVCDRCLDRHYEQCNRCDEYHRQHKVVRLGERLYCLDCLTELKIMVDNVE